MTRHFILADTRNQEVIKRLDDFIQSNPANPYPYTAYAYFERYLDEEKPHTGVVSASTQSLASINPVLPQNGEGVALEIPYTAWIPGDPEHGTPRPAILTIWLASGKTLSVGGSRGELTFCNGFFSRSNQEAARELFRKYDQIIQEVFPEWVSEYQAATVSTKTAWRDVVFATTSMPFVTTVTQPFVNSPDPSYKQRTYYHFRETFSDKRDEDLCPNLCHNAQHLLRCLRGEYYDSQQTYHQQACNGVVFAIFEQYLTEETAHFAVVGSLRAHTIFPAPGALGGVTLTIPCRSFLEQQPDGDCSIQVSVVAYGECHPNDQQVSLLPAKVQEDAAFLLLKEYLQLADKFYPEYSYICDDRSIRYNHFLPFSRLLTQESIFPAD